MATFPPPLDDTTKLIQYAIVTPATPSSGKTRHWVSGELVGPAAGLAIRRSDSDGYYLFGCDANWEIVTDTWHATLEEAVRQAEFEYPGISRYWQKPE